MSLAPLGSAPMLITVTSEQQLNAWTSFKDFKYMFLIIGNTVHRMHTLPDRRQIIGSSRRLLMGNRSLTDI